MIRVGSKGVGGLCSRRPSECGHPRIPASQKPAHRRHPPGARDAATLARASVNYKRPKCDRQPMRHSHHNNNGQMPGRCAPFLTGPQVVPRRSTISLPRGLPGSDTGVKADLSDSFLVGNCMAPCLSRIREQLHQNGICLPAGRPAIRDRGQSDPPGPGQPDLPGAVRYNDPRRSVNKGCCAS